MPYQGTKLTAMILTAWHRSGRTAFTTPWDFQFENFIATLAVDTDGRVSVVRVKEASE